MLATIRSIARVIKHSRLLPSSHSKIVNDNVCFVFGNGPSLAGDVEGHLDALRLLDTCCVNQFCESILYTTIRPKIYVLADPDYWIDEISAELMQMRNRLVECILKNTTWDLKFYVPFPALDFFKNAFFSLENIRVIGYNNVPLHGKSNVLHYLFDRGWGCPPAQNVLIAALFITIRLNYKKIILLGADHSWHETLALDGDNRVCVKNNHFYNANAQLAPWTMGGKDDRIFTMGAIFFALAKMFNGYWRVREYADYRGVEIVNASSLTYVDAFRRTSLSKVISACD